jgi:hypothetical protein
VLFIALSVLVALGFLKSKSRISIVSCEIKR